MKYILSCIMVLLLMLFAACDSTSDKLTETDIDKLKVPDGFDFEMSTQVDVDIQGAWRLPLYLKTSEGKVLFKALLNPETGMKTKLTLPKTIKEVIIQYQSFEVPVNISAGTLHFDFRSDW